VGGVGGPAAAAMVGANDDEAVDVVEAERLVSA
jgi:hypothetical protein